MNQFFFALPQVLVCIFFSGKIAAQKISISVDHVPFKSVIPAITSQTGCSIFCDRRLLRKTTKVSLHFSEMAVDTILASALRQQKIKLTYVREAGSFIIMPAAASPLPNLLPASSGRVPIQGVVVNSSGEPVPSAHICISGGERIVFVNLDGSFSLSLNATGSKMTIWAPGYRPALIDIPVESSTLCVVLNETLPGMPHLFYPLEMRAQ